MTPTVMRTLWRCIGADQPGICDVEQFVIPPDLTIVVPAYNEAENLPTVVHEVRETFRSAGLLPPILIVDDGSSDTTRAVVASLASDRYLAPLTCITHSRNLGLGVALRTGFVAADTAWVGWLPADAQFRAQDLLRLYQSRADHVAMIGGFTVTARRRADSIVRVALSKAMRLIMRVLHPSMPTCNGIMVLQRRIIAFEDLVCQTGVVINEILDRIRRAGEAARIAEHLVSLRERRAGTSKVTNTRTMVLVLLDFLRLRIVYLGLRGRRIGGRNDVAPAIATFGVPYEVPSRIDEQSGSSADAPPSSRPSKR
jgi:dolichol-phosphate mannosyltransferase